MSQLSGRPVRENWCTVAWGLVGWPARAPEGPRIPGSIQVNERCKVTYLKEPNSPVIKVGDEVFIINYLTKLRGRDQYKVVELKNEDDIDWAVLQKSDSQLRSKRYELKLTEIIPVPFGSNTIKDIPKIIFSQEIDPIRGFTGLPEEKSKRHQVALSIPKDRQEPS